MEPKTPWFIELEHQLETALLITLAVIVFDFFGINPAHHSGKMLQLSINTVKTWVRDYEPGREIK